MRFVKPKDEEVDAVLTSANEIVNADRSRVNPVEREYAKGVAAAVKWMIHGGTPPINAPKEGTV